MFTHELHAGMMRTLFNNKKSRSSKHHTVELEKKDLPIEQSDSKKKIQQLPTHCSSELFQLERFSIEKVFLVSLEHKH